MKRAIVLVVLAACDAASSDPGLDATLQIPGAQFRPGPFPSATGGPVALSVVTTHANLVIGREHEKLHGVFDGRATAAIIGIEGTDGAWIVTAGPPDIDVPGSATVTATFGFARDTAPGPFLLAVAATDAEGRIGEAATVDVLAQPETPPDGDLVLALTWDSSADLDLHVVDPVGGEAWSGHPNTWQAPPPGTPSDPEAWRTGGILDHDGNRDCHRDGAPSEHVIWTTRMGANGPVAPIIPAGEYVVRVDARSMCDDASAAWYVAAYTNGQLVRAARGISIQDDVQEPHGAGAGVTALRFTVP